MEKFGLVHMASEAQKATEEFVYYIDHHWLIHCLQWLIDLHWFIALIENPVLKIVFYDQNKPNLIQELLKSIHPCAKRWAKTFSTLLNNIDFVLKNFLSTFWIFAKISAAIIIIIKSYINGIHQREYFSYQICNINLIFL